MKDGFTSRRVEIRKKTGLLLDGFTSRRSRKNFQLERRVEIRSEIDKKFPT